MVILHQDARRYTENMPEVGSYTEMILRVVMRKDNIEKQIKIIGIMVILASISLLILGIYFVYCFGAFQDLSDIYYLIFGALLLMAGLGLVKYKSWARKMLLYTMAAHLFAGIFDLFCSIRIIFPPKNGHISTDYHLLIYAILVMAIMFIIISVLPTVGVFCLLNRKEIKELFREKKIITKQSGEKIFCVSS